MSLKTLSVPWGEGKKEFQLPEESIVWTISPKAIKPVQDEREEILRAMREPIGMPPIPEVLGDPAGKRIAIVVDDNTRVTPISACALETSSPILWPDGPAAPKASSQESAAWTRLPLSI